MRGYTLQDFWTLRKTTILIFSVCQYFYPPLYLFLKLVCYICYLYMSSWKSSAGFERTSDPLVLMPSRLLALFMLLWTRYKPRSHDFQGARNVHYAFLGPHPPTTERSLEELSLPTSMSINTFFVRRYASWAYSRYWYGGERRNRKYFNFPVSWKINGDFSLNRVSFCFSCHERNVTGKTIRLLSTFFSAWSLWFNSIRLFSFPQMSYKM